MKIYILGSMIGALEQRRAEYEMAEKELNELGLRAVNEFKLGIPAGWTGTDRRRKVTEVIGEHCGAVYMLRGWKESNDARLLLEASLRMRKMVFWEESNDIITIRQYIHDGIIETERKPLEKVVKSLAVIAVVLLLASCAQPRIYNYRIVDRTNRLEQSADSVRRNDLYGMIDFLIIKSDHEFLMEVSKTRSFRSDTIR